MECNDKTVIITGGNTGLGYQCAINIAASDQNYTVVILCRNLDKANQAVKKMMQKTGNKNIYAMELDLASLASVRSFFERFIKLGYLPIHAVVCNAGVQIVNQTVYTKDGFEMTFGVNHLAHFLLVNLLLNKMSDTGRIVFVSSGTHDPLQKTGLPEPRYANARQIAFQNGTVENNSPAYVGRLRYTTSKLCNLYCAYELAERIRTDTEMFITVNAFDPGMMPGTGLASSYNFIQRFAWKYILPILTLFMRNVNSVNKSGKALSELVTNPQFDLISGKYFEGTKEIKSSSLSYSKENAKDLWNTSIELVRLQQNETIFSLEK